MSDETTQVEAAGDEFERDFASLGEVQLVDADPSKAEELLRILGELKVRHTGKKSAIAAAKKLIGKVASEKRADFGQLVQTVENKIVSKIAETEA